MNLFQHHNYISKLEQRMGIDQLSPTARLIYSIIDEYGTTNITKLDNHWLFDGISLSTTKRAVVELLERGIIKKDKNQQDKRENFLTLV